MRYKSGGLGFFRGLVAGGIAIAGLILIPQVVPNDNSPIFILTIFAVATVVSIVLGIAHQVKGKSWPSTYAVGLFGGFTTVFDLITIVFAVLSRDLVEFIHRVLI